MKNKLICLIIIIVFLQFNIFKAAENYNKTKKWINYPFYIGMAATLGGLSSEIIHKIVINYLEQYYYLIWDKSSSEQLQLLFQARKSINAYTSPVKAKVLDDLIWLHNFITVRCSEMIKGKTSVEQVIVLQKYLDTVYSDYSGWFTESILVQHSWFARQYYHNFPYVTKTTNFNKWFEESFIEGFIREIIKNYDLEYDIIKKFRFRH